MWLETATHHPLKNFYRGRPAPPDVLVVHWSAGGGGEPAAVARYLAGRRASYHVVIGRDGALGQLVSLDDAAWHAGDGRAWSKVPSINRRSIGVCLCNRGPVTEAWATTHPDRVWRGKHPKRGILWTRYERYTAEQRAALVALIADLEARLPSLAFVTGHEDLTSGKGDPGPCLPLLDIDWSALGLTYRRHDWRTGEWSDG